MREYNYRIWKKERINLNTLSFLFPTQIPYDQNEEATV